MSDTATVAEHLPQRKVFSMVSVMESFSDAEAALAEAERASAAVYIDYPPTPKWYPPAIGAWAAGFALTVANLHRNAIAFPALLVLVTSEVALLSWYRHYRGTMPTLRDVPPEIAAAMWRYAAGLVAVVALAVGSHLVAGPVATALATFASTTLLIVWYERGYARAAAATRARLS